MNQLNENNKENTQAESESTQDQKPTNEQYVKISGLDKSRDKKAPGAFRTISEVADELDVAAHVLRFWETKFNQIKPLKRGGGRRYYRPEDVALLKHIHYLLYTEGYTIKGVQKLFKGQSKHQILTALIDKGSIETRPVVADQSQSPAVQDAVAANAGAQTQAEESSTTSGLTKKQRSILEAMLGELKDMRNIINSNEE